jgi:hypothetical protein
MEIGRGAQYKIIDTQDGRVKKISLTREESRAVIAAWYAPNEIPDKELAIDYAELAIEANKRVRGLIHKYPAIAYTFANPIFEGEAVYTQDRVPTLGDILSEGSIVEGQKFIDSYIELILLHWRYGISERVFNSTVNNGVDSDGRVVLLDFGELTSDKDKITQGIYHQRWLQSISYKQLPESLKNHYSDAMNERLTTKTLVDTWASVLSSSSSS